MRTLLLLAAVTGLAAAEARAPRLLKYVKPVSPQHMTTAVTVTVSLTIGEDGKVNGARPGQRASEVRSGRARCRAPMALCPRDSEWIARRSTA